MLFNSLTFIIFFSIVLALHSLPLSWGVRKFNLLIASYLFYAAWSPPFVVLLWIATLIDWSVAQRLARTESDAQRKRLLFLSLAANLGLLGYFKYGNFLIVNFTAAMKFLGVNYQPAAPDIVLPVGISFYTFVTLSYTIDVYRRKLAPAQSLLDYALLVTFFPHLVAGPILRAAQFLPQCLTPRRASAQQLGWGLSLLVLGLFEKVVLADGLLAPVTNEVFNAKGNIGAVQGWVATLAFMPQLMLDFEGYSLCAVGAAACLGFTFPHNFRFPFGAVGLREVWRRWHISLTTWFRDYLYFPLVGWLWGKLGRRSGWVLPVGTFITMCVSGLWHGAAWHFIIWGVLLGLCLALETIWQQKFPRGVFSANSLTQLGLACLTFVLFNLLGVFFRAGDVGAALRMYRAMFTGRAATATLYNSPQALGAIAVVGGLFALHWFLRDATWEQAAARLPWWAYSLLLTLLLFGIITLPRNNHAFIYFQF